MACYVILGKLYKASYTRHDTPGTLFEAARRASTQVNYTFLKPFEAARATLAGDAVGVRALKHVHSVFHGPQHLPQPGERIRPDVDSDSARRGLPWATVSSTLRLLLLRRW